MIKLLCTCSKSHEVPDTLANQKIKCNFCGKVLKVPPPPKRAAPGLTDSDPTFQIPGYRKCGGCGKSYPPHVKICVECGLDLDSGALLYASMEDGPKVINLPPEEEARAPVARRPQGFLPRLLALFGLSGKPGRGARN